MDIWNIVLEKLQGLPHLVIEFAPAIALALAIYLIGRFIVRRLSHATLNVTRKMPNIDETLGRFFGSVVLFIGMSIVIVSALSALSIPLGFLATIAASLMIAIGFALQDTLGDVASGLMIIAFRPFVVGEEVEISGEVGVIKEVGLFTTRMITRDNIEVVVANSNALGNTIKNFYAFKQRRLDMDFGVSYDADLDIAIDAIKSAIDGHASIQAEPAPWAKVTNLGDSAVTIQLRVWCDADDYRGIKMDLPAKVKVALDAAGIEIPYEHQVVIHAKEVING